MLDAITKMTNRIVAIMDGNIYGVWLYGSVVLEDFRPGWSDIDFVALTDGPISESRAGELLTLRQDMLKTEPDNPYYRAFEGIIADRQEYLSQSFRRLVYWGTGGQRVTDRFAHDAFSLFELAKYGKPIYGEVPWVLPPPDREELIKAVRAHYASIRQYAAKTSETLYSCGWLLDIARCIYTLRYHDVIAKTQAGLWALEAHIFHDETPLRKTIEIRQQPNLYKDNADIRHWLKGLGPVVQNYADVLEHELLLLRGQETI